MKISSFGKSQQSFKWAGFLFFVMISISCSTKSSQSTNELLKPNESSDSGKELTSEDYAKLISSDDYVLVDFHAEWCGPCKKLKPILDEIGKEYADQITIFRIDVDKNPTISNQMNVSGIPDIRLYKNRKLVWEMKGLVEKSVIVEQIK